MKTLARKRKKEKYNRKPRLLITKVKPKSPVSEQYRTIRTNILFSAVDDDLKTLMFTSTAPGEGKTTTAANIAVVFAQQGKKVLLVDADLRKPTIHYTFNLMNIHGLTSVLTKRCTLEEAIEDGGVENLYVLTSGPIPPNPAEMLSSKAFEKFFETVKEQFDLVIFDTPPILAVTDGQIIANKCDGTILVVSAGKTEKLAAKKAKELLLNAKGRLLGAILNNKKQDQTHYYYYHGAK